MITSTFINPKHVQGSIEWLDERRKHIGASDAAIILGISPWKTPYQLWEEKKGLSKSDVNTFAMQRGTDMEPIARRSYEELTNKEVFPQCVYHDENKFMMASMDGLSLNGDYAVEIKCPGEKVHSMALNGEIPDYYMSQLQHQMSCANLKEIDYYSYDGENGKIVKVQRDDEYIANLITKERQFFSYMKIGTPPPLTDRDYVVKHEWVNYYSRLAELDEMIKAHQNEKDDIKKELVKQSDGHSCRCNGLSLTKSISQGRVDYKLIPEIKDVNLDKYRKEAKEQWTLRISKNV